MLKKGREHVRTLREGRRQFLWRKTIPLICLVSSKSRKSTFMNAYHLQILPPHMLAQGFLKKPFNGFLRAFALLSGEHAKTVKNPRKNDCFKVVKSLPCDDFFAGLLKQTKITAPLGLQNLQNWRQIPTFERLGSTDTHLCSMWWRKCYFMVHKRLLIFFLLDFENRRGWDCESN